MSARALWSALIQYKHEWGFSQECPWTKSESQTFVKDKITVMVEDIEVSQHIFLNELNSGWTNKS